MRTFILVIITLAFAYGCLQENKKSVNTKDQIVTLISGNWYGSLPCADCESIDYKLTLNKDMTFTEESLYRGKSETPVVNSGKWEIMSDSVISLNKQDSQQMFLLTGMNLVMLDRSGKRIESSFEDKYKLGRDVVEKNPEIERSKFDKGIDFTARGNEPFWSLDIDFDKSITFNSLTEIPELIVPAVKGVKAQDEDIILYESATKNGEIKITVKDEPCTDNMSGEKFDYSVMVKVKKTSDSNFTEFYGCGKYLVDYRLNDIWLMQEMTGVVLKKEELQKGLPVFEFHLKEKRFAGHAGCNNLIGSINVTGNKISFGKIASTLMACPNMDVERAVTSALNDHSFTYSIEKLTLTLISDSGIRMVFKKID